MSDVMLHAVLNMPPDMWDEDDIIGQVQRHARYVEASERIIELEQQLVEAKAPGYILADLPTTLEHMPKQLKELYIWMARVKFYNPADEVIAAQYAAFIKVWLEDISGMVPVFEKVHPVRYLPANEMSESQRTYCVRSELYNIGDAVLVWANEGDLCRQGQQMLPPPERRSADRRNRK
jgi:hypothetical protein